MPDPEPLTAVELDELRRLCEAATPGPWHWHAECDMPGQATSAESLCAERDEGDGVTVLTASNGYDSADVYARSADAAFIAASREAVPRLLATVTALQADVDRLRARTHEIQAEESQRNAANEAQYVRVRNAIEAAQRWVSADEWRHMSSVNAYALGAQQERITALEEALREASMVVAEMHNVCRNVRFDEARPDYCPECHDIACEYAESWRAWRALLGDAPVPLALEGRCATCGHPRRRHGVDGDGWCTDTRCACVTFAPAEAGEQ